MPLLKGTLFLLVICMIVVNRPASSRKPPYNGSIFGKRFARESDGDRGNGDYRPPSCEYICEQCNQCNPWYLNGQDSP